MSNWTRDNKALRADYPLSAGALQDIICGNAEHIVKQCVTDITTPLVGDAFSTSGGIQEYIMSSKWVALWKRIRPFAVPVHTDTDGTFMPLQFDLSCTKSASTIGNTFRVYLATRPPAVWTTQHSARWTDALGLLGVDYEVRGDYVLPNNSGDYTATVTVTPTEECITSVYPGNLPNNAWGAREFRSATVTWAILDLYVLTAETVTARVLRVRSVPG